MKAEELLAVLSDTAKKNEFRFESIRERLPLGVYADGSIATAHREEKPDRYHFCLVSGENRTDFILRLVLTLVCIYDRSEAEFLILSPKREYAELLRLVDKDVVIPYLRSEEDFFNALNTIKELIFMRSIRSGYPKLFVVADGLEEVEGLAFDDVTEPYLTCLQAVGQSCSEVIAGLNMTDSVYSGFPGAIVGIGNCLVSTKSGGKADITHVGADSSLGVPREADYPTDPTVVETVEEFNRMTEQGDI